MTGAECAGRQDTCLAAEKMGIKLRKQWLATLDNRTRHEHALLDGQTVAPDKPFTVDGYELMFPDDKSAPAYLVYNCRCTVVADLDGVDTSDARRWARDPETGERVLIGDMSYSEWAGWKKRGMSAGDRKSTPGVPEQIGEVDYRDEKSVLKVLADGEKKAAGLDYEVNYTVTSDGKVWRVLGESASVNPSAIPSSLIGSYSYHNHPADKTHYSFSAEDIAFFFESGEEYSKASDDLFEYVMRRTADIVEMPPEDVYNRFKEIDRSDVYQLMWEGKIDSDLDEYHEVLKRISKELGFYYERKKRDQ